MSPTHLEFAGSDGRPVRGTMHPAEDADAPVVVVVHGFKGFREWGFFPTLAERIAAAGLNALRIDYSHNGVEEKDFDRLDLFEQDTWTRHQEDLEAVVDGVGADVLGICGHSRGGADAILAAQSDARIRAVCALAPVADTARFPADWEEKLAELGHYPMPNQRTGQVMPVGRAFFEDSRKHDVLAAARWMGDRPLCVIEAGADESVPAGDARRLAEAHGDAELHVVAGAGHTFGAVHPFQGMTPHLEEAFRHAVAFLKARVV